MKISTLADEILERFPLSEKQLLDYLQSVSGDKKGLKRSTGQNPDESKLAYLLFRPREVLSEYLGDIEKHLRSVSLYKHFTDRPLLTSREQYYLYMLEFELVNRVHLEKFRQASFKIALLPYCLKEDPGDCKARPDEFEYQCKACIKSCYINRASRILREKGINPYILSQGRVKSLLGGLMAKHGSIGVLGIACVVELVWGMRLCMKAGVPVVGIPLNANRCPRWMGSLHDTSLDLASLQRLIID